MAGLANYDGVTIQVSPQTLMEVIQRIAGADPTAAGGLLGDILDRLQNVLTTIHGLRSSWVAGSASEAQDFNDRWNAVMAQLFGTRADPKAGVFPRMMDGLAMAVPNYDGAEDYVVHMFQAFLGAASGDAGGLTSVVNTPGQPTSTAVSEQF